MNSGPIKALLTFDQAVFPGPGKRPGSRLKVSQWEIYPGDCWLLGGFPGSGKSALLAAAAGLLPMKSGLLIPAPMEKAGGEPFAGLVFDRAGRLFRDMSVLENIVTALAYHGMESQWDAGALEALLQDFGLWEARALRPTELQRSLHLRVALARALVIRPKVLLLDDPLSGLDPQSRRWWMQCLHRLVRGDWARVFGPQAMVVACAEAAPLREWANRWAWIEDGEWREVNPEEVRLQATIAGLPEWLGRVDNGA